MTSGRGFFSRAINITRMHPGKDYFAAQSWSRWVVYNVLPSATYLHLPQGYKHVFTSPSSALSIEPKATRSCNARIHGMTSVTIASLAYIATLVIIAFYSFGKKYLFKFLLLCRSGFRCLHPLFSRGRIVPPTQNSSMTPLLNC